MKKIFLQISLFILVLGSIFNYNHIRLNDKKNIVAENTNNSVSKIRLDKSVLNIKVGETIKLVATTTPSNMNNELLWVSNNKNVATVDTYGNVKGINLGTAYIIVAAKNNYSVRSICKITVTSNSSQATTNNNQSANNNSSQATTNNNQSTNNNSSQATTNNNQSANNNSSKATTNNNQSTNNNSSKATTNNNQSTNSKTTTTTKVNAQAFINALEKMSQTAKNDYKKGHKWKYSNSGTNGSFAIAVSKNNRKTNCAKYVSWGLVEIGILKSGQSFYKKSSSTIKYSSSDAKNRMHNKLTYISGNGKKVSTLISEGKLKAGDIVLWQSKQHTNVYAGNKKWYDAGRWNANAGKTGFKTFGPVSISTLNNSWRVWKILRVK